MFFALSNHNISPVYIQNNQVHCSKIEAFCKKRIKSYSRRLFFAKENTPSYETDSQIKEQYERLLFLLEHIRSNPDHLDGHEYLKLLYEAEAIFKRSKIICND